MPLEFIKHCLNVKTSLAVNTVKINIQIPLEFVNTAYMLKHQTSLAVNTVKINIQIPLEFVNTAYMLKLQMSLAKTEKM